MSDVKANSFIWEQFFLMAGVATVVLAVFLPLCYLILTRLDKKPKDGPRCRKCGMDLRACTSQSCTECGADLSKKGVWPIGLPKRGPAIIAISVWSWLLFCLFSLGIIHLNEYQYDLFHTKFLYKSVLRLDDPVSTNDMRIIIEASGSRLILLDQGQPLEVEPEQITVEVFNQGGTLGIAAIDIENKQLVMPQYDGYKRELEYVFGDAPIDFEKDVTSFLIDGISRNATKSLEDLIKEKEIEQAVEIAYVFADRIKRLGEGKELPEGVYDDVAENLSSPLLFESAWTTDWEDVHTERPPDAIFWVFPVASLIAWLIGIFVLRKRTYARMASDGIPSDNLLSSDL